MHQTHFQFQFYVHSGRGENDEQEKKIPPSYTRAELDLLKNLEREVW
jgi:hypothetical protein